MCWTTASQLAGPVRREVYEGVRENEKIERRGGNIRGGDRAGEQGMGSLEFVVYRISGFLSTPFGSLTPLLPPVSSKRPSLGVLLRRKRPAENKRPMFSVSSVEPRVIGFTSQQSLQKNPNHPIFEGET